MTFVEFLDKNISLIVGGGASIIMVLGMLAVLGILFWKG